MTDWFRSWHGAPTDPKWLGIARRASVAPGIAVAVAWALMDRASQASDRGSIEGYDADGLACFYGCEPEQVDAIVTAMADKGMLVDLRFTSWEKRQPKREDGAAERAKEWRERNRTQENAAEPPDTDTEKIQKEKKKERVPRDELGDVLDAVHADAVIEHRQRLRKPLSAYAAKKLAATLAKFPDPNAAADRMIEKGWASIEVGWEQRKQSPPEAKGVVGAAQRMMEKSNGSESIFGGNSDVKRLSSGGSIERGGAPEDIRGGIGRQFARGSG